MTGYFARGTGWAGTTSVGFGLYSRIERSCAMTAADPASAAAPARRRDWRRPARGVMPPGYDMSQCRSRAVSRILSAFRRDDHSSSPVITGGGQRPNPRVLAGPPQTPPYLVLLRAGFCLPPVLPRARCALTAPFHPYLTAVAGRRGGIFSVPLSFELPRPGITRRTALRSSDFPPLVMVPGEPGLPRAAIVWRGCGYPSDSCLILYCSSFLYRLLRGVSMSSAVFEIFQPVSRSFCTRKARSDTSLCSRSVPALTVSLSGPRDGPSTRMLSGRSARSMLSAGVMMIKRSTVFRSSRMLPFQR